MNTFLYDSENFKCFGKYLYINIKFKNDCYWNSKIALIKKGIGKYILPICFKIN